MPPPRTRHVVGCMTGTSLDGLDAALVRITGTGLDMAAEFLGMVSESLGDLADTLRALTTGTAHPPLHYMRAARKLGELHADAVERLLRECTSQLPDSRVATRPRSAPRRRRGSQSDPAIDEDAPSASDIDFIVAHGQTIWHAPSEHLSWQLFDPWPLVQRLRVPVCYDLRQADLIAGGEGAPITPLADWVMYRPPKDRFRSIYNLGGIMNQTHLSHELNYLEAADIGPCNIVLDSLIQRLFPTISFDKDGGIAAQGTWRPDLMNIVAKAIDDVCEHHRTMGRENFDDPWMDAWLIKAREDYRAEDVVQSVVRAIGDLVFLEHMDDVLPKNIKKMEIVLAGGGARNPELVKAIAQPFALSWPNHHVLLSDDLGIPCEAREAMGFAVLGALARDGVDITLTQVTGRATNARGNLPGAGKLPRAGAWVYPA